MLGMLTWPCVQEKWDYLEGLTEIWVEAYTYLSLF
jgi:hypothetical protein